MASLSFLFQTMHSLARLAARHAETANWHRFPRIVSDDASKLSPLCVFHRNEDEVPLIDLAELCSSVMRLLLQN
jgi:hypothetical protein